MTQFSKLETLQKYSIVVADTGDLQAIAALKPHDATTNPSLVLKALTQESMRPRILPILHTVKNRNITPEQKLQEAIDSLTVWLGTEILQMIPGYVSTEVDARLSFQTDAMVSKALHLIESYAKAGVDKSRVLIKLAATWEGVQAAKLLKKQGIQCNMTLIFNISQALSCLAAEVFLISPFVGRVLDWYVEKNDRQYSINEDPGVLLVKQIYHAFKEQKSATIVMGASFRNQSQIEALAGCDRLTISPSLMEQLQADTGLLEKNIDRNFEPQPYQIPLLESQFRWQMNQDPMATEKLAQGIRNFAVDTEKLESFLQPYL